MHLQQHRRGQIGDGLGHPHHGAADHISSGALNRRVDRGAAGETGLRAEAVGNVTVRNDAPPWLLLVALLGWLAPSPGEIARKLRGLMGMK